MKHADVVVVGAGLAGLQCARLLAQNGLRVILIDRKQRPGQFVHTTGIFVRRTFEEFSLPAGTLGPPIRRVSVHAPSGRSVMLESGRDEFRIGRMKRLYELMLEEACANGMEFIGGVSFDGVDFAAHDVRAKIRRGSWSDRVAARLVVGADGASSRTAAALGLTPPQSFLTGVEGLVHQSSGMAPQLHCFLDSELAPGYIAWIASDGEEIHAGAAGTAGTFDGAAALARVRELVREHCGIDAEFDELRGGRIPVGGVLPEIATTRGLLVGDAAGAVSPLTAGGLDAAIRLSAFAAQAIVKVLSEGGNLSRLYSGERFRARFLSRLSMRKLFTMAQSRLTSEAAVAFLRTPLGRLLGERLFFGHGSFPIPSHEIAAPFRLAPVRELGVLSVPMKRH